MGNLCSATGSPSSDASTSIEVMPGTSQLKCSLPAKFQYFGLLTPVGLPGQVLMELSGQEYEAVVVQMEQWADLKPTVVNNVLPNAYMPDGSVMAESAAIARVIAAASGRLGQGRDYMVSEMLAGMTKDLIGKVMDIAPTVFSIKTFDEKSKATFDEKKPEVLAHLDKYTQFLKGDKFTSTGLTYGEIDLFCKLHCCSQGAFPEVTTGTLAPFYNRIANTPAVKKLLDGQSRYGKLGAYLLPLP
eukprot:TRINITY_DN83701_c0_g1_i1.p1 TRINITY_DN83701_c0_g1~~TRINITY_DN83701_c0_g1_i1.p1  ORF type:complete len:244 (+),score=51.62 TRINITY_DN83701_c0_g1_i1:89-820(+)